MIDPVAPAAGATESRPAQSDQLQVIEPRRSGMRERIRELVTHRGLLRFFASRAIEKVTRRTILGRIWLFLRPLLNVAAQVLIFGGLLKVPSEGIPYVVFFLAGITAWTLFENTLVWSTRSLELNRKLLQKVYFPRIILPVASSAPALYELAMYSFLLVLAITVQGLVDGRLYVELGPQLLLLPVVLALAGGLALSIGIWTSVIGANVRDVRYSLLYVLQFWFLVSPVIYPLSVVPETYRPLAELNPMSPILESFRWCLFGTGDASPVGLASVALLIVAIGTTGLWYFGRAESAAVDRL